MSIGVKVALIVAVAIIFVVAIGYFLIQCFEVTTERVYVGYKGAARSNPYLAAERLLKKRDKKIEYIHNEHQIASLPSKEGTIFFLINRDNFKMENLEKLLSWVESGGNLIINLPLDSFSDEDLKYRDFFTYYLGIEVKKNPDAGDNFNKDITGMEKLEDNCYDVLLPEIDKQLSVTLNKSLILTNTNKTAYWAITEQENAIFLQFKIKQGYISVMISLPFMQNQWIGQNDNARFFWYLTTQGYRKGEVWFIMRHDLPTFLGTLINYSWMFLVSLFIFLVFFIWKSSRRFGPIIMVSESQRRSLIEHVYACGQFLWNRGERGKLLEALKQALNRKIKTKLLIWDTLSPEKQLDIIMQRTGLKRDIINVLFVSYKDKKLNNNQFQLKIKLLERIYNKV